MEAFKFHSNTFKWDTYQILKGVYKIITSQDMLGYPWENFVLQTHFHGIWAGYLTLDKIGVNTN